MLTFENLTAENWEKYKGLILESECTFPAQIRSGLEDFLYILSEGNMIAKVALLGSQYIGNAIGYAITPEEMREFGLEGICESSRMLYVVNLVINPAHQGRGYGSQLLWEIIRTAGMSGFEKIVGHFRPPHSLGIVKRIGGREIAVYRNWENTGEDYVLCCLDLKSIGLRVPVPATAKDRLLASLQVTGMQEASLAVIPEQADLHMSDTLHSNIH